MLILSGMVFIALFYITILIIVAVGCTPQPGDHAMGGWLSPIYHQRCYQFNHGTTAASGVVGAVKDIYILILPLFLVWELRTSTKRKTGLAAIFIVGSSYVSAIFSTCLSSPGLVLNFSLIICRACVFSVVSAYYRLNIIVNPRNDITWDTMPIYGWRYGDLPVISLVKA